MRADPIIAAAATLLLWLLEVALVGAGTAMTVGALAPDNRFAGLCAQIGDTFIAYTMLTPFALAAALLAARLQPIDAAAQAYQRAARTVLPHAGIVGLLAVWAAALWWLSSLPNTTAPMFAASAIVVAVSALATLTLATMVMWGTVAALPRVAVRRAVAVVGGTVVAGFAALTLMHVPLSLALLERTTLHAVDQVLRLIYADVVSDPVYRRVGTAAFRVRIETGCSGIEGVTLGVVVTGCYLYLARHRLRFPRAWLLFGAVVLAVASVNIVRIVALIAVGHYSPALAVGGFHSAIGWFLFAVTTAIVIPSAERVLRLRAVTVAPTTVVDPPLPFLLPLIASLAAGVVITMLGLGDTQWALLRYVLAALALALVWRELPPMAMPRSPLPWVAGALLAAIWGVSAADAQTVPALAALDAPWLAANAVGFVLVTPLVEEVAFRGYLMRRLVSARFAAVPLRETSWGAVIVSSVLFGAMHGMWLEATVAGAVFALVARRFDALGPAFVTHAFTNALLLAYGATTGNFTVVG